MMRLIGMLILACAGLIMLAICQGCGGGVTVTKTPQTYAGVVFIGDSITAAWPIADDFPGAVNLGVGEQTSCQMLARFGEVLALHPSIVVILAGTNDVRYNADTSPACLFDMVTEAEASRAAVIVGTLPANEGWAPGTSPSYGEALYSIWNDDVWVGSGEYGYWVADYFDETQTDGKQNAALFEPDLTHPNAAGYAVLTTTLRPIIAYARQRLLEK